MRGIRQSTLCLLVLFALLSACSASAVTVSDLLAQSSLSPDGFADYFKDFKFVFHPEVQSPQTFLETRSGDCDDYAILAARVLQTKGYTPRLFSVRMSGVVHVVCYIEETRSYLDYNRRKSKTPTVSCDNSVTEIADKVAGSFKLKWTSVSEFTYRDSSKWLVQTVSARGLMVADSKRAARKGQSLQARADNAAFLAAAKE